MGKAPEESKGYWAGWEANTELVWSWGCSAEQEVKAFPRTFLPAGGGRA